MKKIDETKVLAILLYHELSGGGQAGLQLLRQPSPRTILGRGISSLVSSESCN